MRNAIAPLLLALLVGCGSHTSTGMIIPPGGRASLDIDTGGGRMDLKNNGPGTVSVSGSQEVGNLPRADLGAGSTVTWPLQGDATLDIQNASDRQADVRVTAHNARGIMLRQRP
jgi:hypothetical protein